MRTPPLILIVDDNPANRKLLYFALRTGNYEIHEAGSAAEMTPLIEQVTPDLALLDAGQYVGDAPERARNLAAQLREAISLATKS